jgi:hypothetical protein
VNKKSIIITLLTVAVIVWNLTVAYVDKQLQEHSDDSVYASCHKVWAARGLYETHSEQNSIVSMRRAFTEGALGVEVDLYYDVKMQRFIISHDKPVKDSEGNLIYSKKNGELLTLENVLQTVGEGHYFWLDYKNLDKLSVRESEHAIERLLSITPESVLRKSLYIEGSNPFRLSLYTDAGFKTILGIHPLRESNLFSSIVINGYKMGYYFSHITGVALAYGSIEDPIYGEETEKRLASIPTFLFHVPDDKELLHTLVSKSSVRVLLVGRDISINRFDIDSCEH